MSEIATVKISDQISVQGEFVVSWRETVRRAPGYAPQSVERAIVRVDGQTYEGDLVARQTNPGDCPAAVVKFRGGEGRRADHTEE